MGQGTRFVLSLPIVAAKSGVAAAAARNRQA
jgi:hypothetical protein